MVILLRRWGTKSRDKSKAELWPNQSAIFFAVLESFGIGDDRRSKSSRRSSETKIPLGKKIVVCRADWVS